MTESKAHRTKSGRTLSRKDVDAIAEEVEHKDYDVAVLKARRPRSTLMGTDRPTWCPVRIDPELRAAIAARAAADHTTASKIIREALRRSSTSLELGWRGTHRVDRARYQEAARRVKARSRLLTPSRPRRSETGLPRCCSGAAGRAARERAHAAAGVHRVRAAATFPRPCACGDRRGVAGSRGR